MAAGDVMEVNCYCSFQNGYEKSYWLTGTGRHMMPCMMPWLACAFVRAAHGHAQALRTWPPKQRVSRAGGGCGLVQPGALPRRQCPRDDRRPCFSHRVSSGRGVTSLRGHQRIHNVTLRQLEWELTTLS